MSCLFSALVVIPFVSLPLLLYNIFPVLFILLFLLLSPFLDILFLILMLLLLLHQFGDRSTPSRLRLFGGKQNRGRGS